MTRDFTHKTSERHHYTPFMKAKEDIDYDRTVRMFTCAPNPRKRSNNQLTNYQNDLYNVFNHMRRCCDHFVVAPELTEEGNIHYHGWFQISDKIKYYKTFFPKIKKLGYCKFNKLKHTKSDWDYYCQKDHLMMKEYMTPFPTPFTHITCKNIMSMLMIVAIEGYKKEIETEGRPTIWDYIDVK